MNKILLSLVTVSLVSVLAIGATRALFFDLETSNNNGFTAGTLDLKVNGGDVPVTMFSVTEAYPGQSGTATVTLKNDGNINGFVDVQPITLLDEENGCNEAEKTEEPLCDTNTNGELSANMNVVMFIDSDNDGVNDGPGVGGEEVYNGLLSGIATAGYDSSVALNATITKNFIVNWSIPTTATNNIQSDKVTLGMTFELGQTTGQ